MEWKAVAKEDRRRRKGRVVPFRLLHRAPRRSRLLALIVVCILCFILFGPLLPERFGDIIPGFDHDNDDVDLARSRGSDILKYIDPLIGTTNGGHVFPGASLPYGMAKPVADTDSHAENAAGFVSDNSQVIGFSHLHDSGTGGNPSLGNFPIFVHRGCPDDDFAQCKFSPYDRGVVRINGSAHASPGYFSLGLNNSVRAEMTATDHAALYRFSFSRRDGDGGGGGSSSNIQDLGLDGGNQKEEEEEEEEKQEKQEVRGIPYSPLILLDLLDLAQTRTDGGVQIDPESGRIIGEGRYAPSFGRGTYWAYVCADVRGAKMRKTGTFLHGTATEEPKVFNIGDVDYGDDEADTDYKVHSGSAGGWIQFEAPPEDELLVRVGVSFLSTQQACANAEVEIADWAFDETVLAAEEIWADKLSVVEVDPRGVSDELQTVFWSGLYRALLSPQNYTGENQLWESDEPYFDSFYCIWDSFRAQHPLLTIIDPAAQTEMVRSLIDIYRHDGKLPDCRMSFCKGFTQGGSNADVVIADAYIKGLRDLRLNWTTAYEAVVSDAEIEPENWGLEGRGNLASYHRLGYIPWDDKGETIGMGPRSRTVSRLVEYAYEDFAISLLAAGLGHADDAAKYHGRGSNWKKVWNPAQRDLRHDDDSSSSSSQEAEVLSNFTGFLQPRLLDGSWRYQNTRTCSPNHEMHICYYDTSQDTYEGSPWLYSFYAPQDMPSLVQLMGGSQNFVDRLDYFHTSGIIYMGNEQSFLPVFQFHYGGRPGLSSLWAHRYVPSVFNTTVGGLPGNDDCAMGAFSAFVMMGFFPVAGQDVYLLIPPFFKEVSLDTPPPPPIRDGDNGDPKRRTEWKGRQKKKKKKQTKKNKKQKAVIRVRNFDPSYEAKYIVSATLNGKPYTKNWISHQFFTDGGVLEFVVGKEEGSWGTREEDLPPSYYS